MVRLEGERSRGQGRDQRDPTERQPHPLRTQLSIGKLAARMIGFLVMDIVAGFVVYFFGGFKGPKTYSMVDSVYFLSNTITTTGFGDVVPDSAPAKTATSLFIIVNFFMINYFVYPTFLRFVQSVEGNVSRVRRIGYSLLYSLICILIGILLLICLGQYGWGISVYTAVVSFTSTGFGDYSFRILWGRFLGGLWLLVSHLIHYRLGSLVFEAGDISFVQLEQEMRDAAVCNAAVEHQNAIDAAVHERDSARDQAANRLLERDSAVRERDSAIHERDSARDLAANRLLERDSAVHERDSAIHERDSARVQAANRLLERDSAVYERDSARDLAANRLLERDSARDVAANRLLDLENARNEVNRALQERDEALALAASRLLELNDACNQRDQTRGMEAGQLGELNVARDQANRDVRELDHARRLASERLTQLNIARDVAYRAIYDRDQARLLAAERLGDLVGLTHVRDAALAALGDAIDAITTLGRDLLDKEIELELAHNPS